MTGIQYVVSSNTVTPLNPNDVQAEPDRDAARIES